MKGVYVTKKVAFERPVAGPQYYAATSASGWPERFPRKESDDELAKFIGHLQLDELIDNFQEFLDLKREGKSNWSDVLSYLARIFEVKSDDIKYGVAIAFWSAVDKRKKEKK
jgi:hypothetical protein